MGDPAALVVAAARLFAVIDRPPPLVICAGSPLAGALIALQLELRRLRAAGAAWLDAGLVVDATDWPSLVDATTEDLASRFDSLAFFERARRSEIKKGSLGRASRSSRTRRVKFNDGHGSVPVNRQH